MKIELFSDGSGMNANTAGGYGWVLVVDGEKHSEGNGHMPAASNNDSELMAALQGMITVFEFVSTIKKYNETNPDSPKLIDSVTLCSDSQIVLGWANGSYKCRQEAKHNKVESLQRIMKRLNARTQWVKGHSGHVWNERCDVLANLGRHNLGPLDSLPGKKRKPADKGIKTKRHEITVEYNGVPHLVNFTSLTVTPIAK
jgi:ribonuclease HI